MVNANFENKLIINSALVTPTSKVDHLSKPLKARLGTIFRNHPNLFSRSKHHLGRFVGFEAEAQIDETSKVNCKQVQRNRVLPPSCKQDLLKYKQSELFADSTGKADFYCSNLTFVLRNQVKEQRANSKADKNLQKQQLKAMPKPSQLATQPLPTIVKDSERSLYRMTIDFRQINAVTKNLAK